MKIMRDRMARGVADGDVPAGAPVSEMASFYTTVLHGLAVRARRRVAPNAHGCGGCRHGGVDPLVGEKRPRARRRVVRARPGLAARRNTAPATPHSLLQREWS